MARSQSTVATTAATTAATTDREADAHWAAISRMTGPARPAAPALGAGRFRAWARARRRLVGWPRERCGR